MHIILIRMFFLSGKSAKDVEESKEKVLEKLNSLYLETEEGHFDEDDPDDIFDPSSSSDC